MKSRVEHMAVVAPVCSKHDNNALVFRRRLLQSLFDFGVRICALVVNYFLLWIGLRYRLTKTDSARCYSERESQHQNPLMDVHSDLLHLRGNVRVYAGKHLA